MLKIKITTEDFRNATKYADNDACPLATAIRRQLDVDGVSVAIGTVWINSLRTFYGVTCDWCFDQTVYGGVYEGMTIDEMIDLAKSNPDIEFPELELELNPML